MKSVIAAKSAHSIVIAVNHGPEESKMISEKIFASILSPFFQLFINLAIEAKIADFCIDKYDLNRTRKTR
jgi:hypothetical protein